MNRFLILLSLLISSIANSQTIFTEDFSSKTVGLDLTTDNYEISFNNEYVAGATVTATVQNRSGNNIGNMVANSNGGAKMQIAKTISVTPNKTYKLQIDTKGTFKRSLKIYDLNNNELYTSPDYKPSTEAEETEWKTLEVDFITTNETQQVKIALYHNWSGTIDFDNITVTEIVRQNKFYISNSGNDENDGTIDQPWNSLDKLSNTLLIPGDTVFFKKGDRFNGHYVVNGSGDVSKPIVITSYSTGNQPIITGQVGADGGGDYQEAILVENVDNLVFEDLEIQNERTVTRSGVDDTDAYGIYVKNSGTTVMENITFRNVTFKNTFAVQPILDTSDFDTIQVSALGFSSSKNYVAGEEKHIRDILIENCLFANNQRFGVQFKHGGGDTGIGNDEINRNMNIIVRNNEFSYNGGTGVLPNRTYNCLIENNLFDHPGATTDSRMPGRGSSIWNINCINTVMQYNTCLSTRGYLDSHGIHIDNYNKNTFVQYNYMEDCEGGFVEILRGNENAVYRFNVSVNDGFRVNPTWDTSNHTIWVNAVRHDDDAFSPNNHIYIHNNTVVINKPFEGREWTSITMDATNLFVYNNIFSSTNGGVEIGGHLSVQPESKTGTLSLISNNLFEGNINPDFVTMDAAPQNGSPNFMNSGEQKHKYNITPESLAIDNGLTKEGPIIPEAGQGVFKDITSYPIVDFYGNAIDLSSGTPNIGASNNKNTLSINNPVSTNPWVIIPEPKNASILIKSNHTISGPLVFSLIGFKGQTINQQKIDTLSNNNFIFKINNSLANGIYILKIKDGTTSYTKRFVYYQ
ncbi:hypothetical protein FHR24_001161 [Wenyingzhuangia heitensis]|uniref:Por secretion system C-terminal sorting domain-containing protein n=1 Tax=Wenyingzhuangia heitensis TaxID=1487859 RepID=A0ABX0U791_9FLAO|nr:T9SS type A sorting domain-containing protein [Wenyingzhuangia heitensis]NIJ44722.1 hypothetical protein [Wenyingzhuangia heitensis]